MYVQSTPCGERFDKKGQLPPSVFTNSTRASAVRGPSYLLLDVYFHLVTALYLETWKRMLSYKQIIRVPGCGPTGLCILTFWAPKNP